MTKVNLTLGESKSKVDLTLEGKNMGSAWQDMGDGSWGEQEGTWEANKVSLTKELKTKVDLSLESK